VDNWRWTVKTNTAQLKLFQLDEPLDEPVAHWQATADFKEIFAQLRDIYLADERPWIVGYSGGKDSTAVLQMVYYMLKELPPEKRRKVVHVVCNDTLVEIPPIAEHMTKTLEAIRVAGERDGLPIVTRKTIPPVRDRFFVKVIGRGYPAPTRFFRWCTDRMKIRPTTAYIKEQVSVAGEVLIVLGTRRAESGQRAKTIQRYEQMHEGSVVRPHGSLKGAYIYPPIQELSLHDVWCYLLQVQPPWGGHNRDLWALYGRASGRDCPLVVDTTTEPCGNSRFGCWVCTVVREDRAMQGLICDGETWMEPLLQFRNWLKEIREDTRLREPKRRRGSGGPGPFTLEARRMILRRLMDTEAAVGMTLLPAEEKLEIQRLWKLDGYNGARLA